VAHDEILRTISVPAGADLSALQYTFVKLNSSGQVVACAAVTDTPLGILQNKPTSGQTAEVGVHGVSKLVASAAVTPGALIGTAASGKGVTTSATGQFNVGQALTAASGANSIFSVAFQTLSVSQPHA